MVVVVVGGTGQLGQSLAFVASKYNAIKFHFLSKSELDITNQTQIQETFVNLKPQYCINTSAYTAVDKAESASALAEAINTTGVGYLAQACKQTNTTLLHVSTDFVFDGTKTTPYTELDIPNPINVYGKTKLDGELVIPTILEAYYIIRTSWLYSPFANNFMKTMIRLGNERDTLSVVDDQIGTPTQAIDLAEVLIKIIHTDHKNLKSQISNLKLYGLYHFSNEGLCSWYAFAKQIFTNNKISINVIPIPTSAYPTPAERPKYSVLDKSKIKNTFGIDINNWELSLKERTIDTKYI